MITSRQQVTTRRLVAVMAPTGAVCIAAALTVGPRYPLAAMLFTAGFLVLSSAALPAPAWIWWFRLAGRVTPRRVKRLTRMAVSMAVREPRGPRPAGSVRWRLRAWHERAYFHLSAAEWDARVQIGMSLWHSERLAYRLPDPERWDELEDATWPDGSWTAVIEEHWRENEWRRGQ